MKTWITYPSAILVGYAAHLLLGDWVYYDQLLQVAVPFVRELALFILFPVVFTLFAGATASARRHKETTVVFSLTVLWGLLTTLALSFGAMGLTMVFPQGFASFSGGSANSIATNFFDFSNLKPLFLSENAFTQFTVSSISLIPVIVLAFLVGITLRPDKEEIRPAYVVLNSFSEAMVRLAKIFTVLGIFFLMLISAQWFDSLSLTSLLSNSYWYLLGLATLLVATLVVVLPIIYVIFTGFRGGSPWKVCFGAFGAMLASGFSGNLLYGTTTMMALSHQNNKVRKRANGISIPLFTILGRGGSAMVATYTTIEVLKAIQGPLSQQTMIYIALFSALFSFAAAFSPMFEVPFIVMMILQGFNYQSLEVVIGGLVILLPVIRLTSIFIDSAIAAYGSAFCSRVLSPKDRVPYREMM
ncbi:MAG: cation:dicarboxylate symporter family transporter [Sphaerochaetaceae bacterium]|jgi:Na+/H+-dicarboxylate symporter